MTAQSVPVIDIGQLQAPQTLRALDEACREWGFFQVVNHGIAASVTAAVMAEMRGFFAQPSATKRQIERSADNPWGFFDRELTKNTRDWKEIYDYGPSDGEHMRPQWPAGRPGFEGAVRAFPGAVVVASHDEAFLDAIAPTRRLELSV